MIDLRRILVPVDFSQHAKHALVYGAAFARRFQTSIRFPMPDPEQRLRLWRESFESEGFGIASEVDFQAIATRYELAGGAIINVLRYACLMAVERDPPVVQPHDLFDGIRRELQKDGHYVSS